MAVFKYNSWGRTRRPKNSTAKDREFITGSSTLDSLYTLVNTANYTSSHDPANGVYSTQNQRYMHLQCSGSSSGINNVYAYMYASNSWSELVDAGGGSISLSQNNHKVIEIYGVDLVAFNTSSAGGPGVNNYNYAAFSTF